MTADVTKDEQTGGKLKGVASATFCHAQHRPAPPAAHKPHETPFVANSGGAV